MTKYLKKITSAILSVALLAGCSSNQKVDDASTVNAKSDNIINTIENTVNTTSSEVIVNTEFTARDLEVGYEDSTATHISLNGNSMDVKGEGATINGSNLIIESEGVYVFAGDLTDGQIIVDADDSDKIQIVLNEASITCLDSAPIYIKNADKVFITLNEGTENNLTDGSEYVQTDENTVDGVIFSKADITFNGGGTLNIIGNYENGIVSKDDLVITGGIYNIIAVKDALNGKDCVKIKDGTLTLSVEEGNGIQSKNGDDTTKGYVYIAGGEINVLNCQEGIEGTAIVIADGTINITAEDDGMNASSGDSSTTEQEPTMNNQKPMNNQEPINNQEPMNIQNPMTNQESAGNMGGRFDGPGGGGEFGNNTNCYILISGGTINIDASGDGIDSNGSIYISGGTILVSGPSNSGNGGLDYNGTAEITGGVVVVTSSIGMAQGFSSTSTQYSILHNLESSNQSQVKLLNSEGNVLVTFTPNKEYQSIVISTPDLAKDGIYNINAGDQNSEIVINDIVTLSGTQTMTNSGRTGKMDKTPKQIDIVKPQ